MAQIQQDSEIQKKCRPSNSLADDYKLHGKISGHAVVGIKLSVHKFSILKIRTTNLKRLVLAELDLYINTYICDMCL